MTARNDKSCMCEAEWTAAEIGACTGVASAGATHSACSMTVPCGDPRQPEDTSVWNTDVFSTWCKTTPSCSKSGFPFHKQQRVYTVLRLYSASSDILSYIGYDYCNPGTMQSYELTPSFIGANPGNTGWGSGWNYQNIVFFGTNNGAGVFEIDTKSINLVTQTVNLRRVGSSTPTGNNDGMNCMLSTIPYSTCGNKVHGKRAGPVTDEECGDGYIADPTALNEVCESSDGVASPEYVILCIFADSRGCLLRTHAPNALQ